MKTKVLLAICAVLLTGTGFAALTADPNIVNGDFEDPVLGSNSTPDVIDWVEAEDAGNNFSRCNIRLWGPGNWPKGGGGGLNFGQLIAHQTAIYQGVSTFLPNTPYDIEVFIGKRNDQAGSRGRVELWAGGTLVDTDDGMNGDYNDATFQLALAGATLVDSAEWDYSGEPNWKVLWNKLNFTLATGTSHTTSDPLYLLFVKTGGGQAGLDDITMSISDKTVQVAPKDGAVDVPLATDLEWVGPGTYDNEIFDVYLGTTEPNFLFPAPYGLETTVATGTPANSASPTLDYETTYYWVVDTYEPNTAPGATDYFYHPATTYSSFTTLPADVPPVVEFTQDGFRTWLEGPAVTVSATVTDLETIASIDWAFTTVPANYTGDPNLFLTDNTIDNTAPTADIVINTTDPNAAGFYVLTLTATDDAAGEGALTGSAEVWFTVHQDGCGAFIANGNNYRAYDANDDCVIDLTDAAAWFALWLEDRSATDPIIYLN